MNGFSGFPSLLRMGPAFPRRGGMLGSRRSEYGSWLWRFCCRESSWDVGVGIGVGGAKERIVSSWAIMSRAWKVLWVLKLISARWRSRSAASSFWRTEGL